MTTISNRQILVQQHRQLEAGLARCAQGGGPREELAHLARLLRQHIYVEEAFLFPALESDERPWMLPALARMCEEHGEMWRHAERVRQQPAATAPELVATATRLARLLEVHDRKEEEAIYAAAARYEAGPDRPPFTELFATTDAPVGWRYRYAPAE